MDETTMRTAGLFAGLAREQEAYTLDSLEAYDFAVSRDRPDDVRTHAAYAGLHAEEATLFWALAMTAALDGLTR